MVTRKFTKDELVEDLDLPNCVGKHEGVEVLSDEMIEHRRWAIDHELIFRLPDQPEGEAWRVFYSVGATESQDERPWEYDDTIEATLVKAVQKTITVWEEVS